MIKKWFCFLLFFAISFRPVVLRGQFKFAFEKIKNCLSSKEDKALAKEFSRAFDSLENLQKRINIVGSKKFVPLFCDGEDDKESKIYKMIMNSNDREDSLTLLRKNLAAHLCLAELLSNPICDKKELLKRQQFLTRLGSLHEVLDEVEKYFVEAQSYFGELFFSARNSYKGLCQVKKKNPFKEQSIYEFNSKKSNLEKKISALSSIMNLYLSLVTSLPLKPKKPPFLRFPKFLKYIEPAGGNSWWYLGIEKLVKEKNRKSNFIVVYKLIYWSLYCGGFAYFEKVTQLSAKFLWEHIKSKKNLSELFFGRSLMEIFAAMSKIPIESFLHVFDILGEVISPHKNFKHLNKKNNFFISVFLTITPYFILAAFFHVYYHLNNINEESKRIIENIDCLNSVMSLFENLADMEPSGCAKIIKKTKDYEDLKKFLESTCSDSVSNKWLLKEARYCAAHKILKSNKKFLNVLKGVSKIMGEIFAYAKVEKFIRKQRERGKEVCYVKFNEKGFFSIKNAYLPSVDIGNQIKNDVVFSSENRNKFLVAPCGSGKTVLLKMMAINSVYFPQTFGIAFAKNCTTPIFHLFAVYGGVFGSIEKGISNGQSQLSELQKISTSIKTNSGRTLFLGDELLNGMAHHITEMKILGTGSSSAFYKILEELTNCFSITSSHIVPIIAGTRQLIENKKFKSFENYYMVLDGNIRKGFIAKYKLCKGQHPWYPKSEEIMKEHAGWVVKRFGKKNPINFFSYSGQEACSFKIIPLGVNFSMK